MKQVPNKYIIKTNNKPSEEKANKQIKELGNYLSKNWYTLSQK